MFIEKFNSAAGSKIAVTATATNIFDLVNTSQSTELGNAGFSSGVNAIIIQPENGDIRLLFGDLVPTATNGFLIPSGAIATLCNVPLKSLKLIRTGAANVNCSIQIGKSDPSESSSIIPSGGSAVTSIIPGTGATNLGKAEDAAHTSGDTGVMLLAVRNDAGAALAGTTGDYIPLTTDANGNLRIASGSGGSAGGGNNTYSTEQGDFTATPTDATFAIVLNVDSVGGVALTAANFANAILKIMDVSLTPDEYKTVTLDKFTWTAATKTLDITNCTGAFTLGTGDIVSLTLVGTDKMRDSGTDAQRASLIRDVSDQWASAEIVNTTNVATGTYYYGSMDGYEDLSFSGTLIDGVGETTTLTLEVSNVGGTTAADWMKVYFRDDMLNTNVNEMAATNETKYFACSAPGIGSFKEYRYLITTSAATNTVKITSKRKY